MQQQKTTLKKQKKQCTNQTKASCMQIYRQNVCASQCDCTTRILVRSTCEKNVIPIFLEHCIGIKLEVHFFCFLEFIRILPQ